MWSAVRDVFGVFKAAFTVVQRHKAHIALALTAGWLAVTAWPWVAAAWLFKKAP